MKKTLNTIAAVALIALTAVACQKESLVDKTSDGSESVTFTVQTDLAATKAVADNDGMGGTIDKCLVAVYMKTGENSYKLYDTPETTGSGLNYTFTVNLLRKQTYQIVVWAHKDGAYTVDYTDTPDQISVSRNGDACNSDAYDAFYASVPFTQGTTASTSIVAKRPFAQLNLITKDLRTGFEPKNIELTYTADTKFNPFDGTTSDPQEITYTAAAPYYASLTVPGENTVAMNYLLAGDEQVVLSEVKLKVTFTDDVEIAVANVPVKRNYRTNIKGNLFTEQTDYTITVDAGWLTPDIGVDWVSVATVAEANAALSAGTATNVTIESVADGSVIVIPETSNTIGIALPSGNASALTIQYETSSESGQTPNLNVSAENNTGNLVIDAPQSHVTLNGTTYYSVTASTSSTTLVVEEGVTIETLKVNQGAVEIYGTVNTINCADGCSIKVWAVGDQATFYKAYDKGAETIQLKNDIKDFTSCIEIGRSINLDGQGHEIWNTANRVIRITAPDSGESSFNMNFKNLGIISKCTATSDVRGISFDNNCVPSNVVFDGCKISASFYAINLIPGSQEHNITIKNATVAAGWAAINCYANNSTFTVENSILKGLNDKGESSWNDFATIVFDGNGLRNAANIGVNGTGNKLNVVNSTIYASSESSNNQAWLALQYGAQRNIVKVDAATRIIDNSGNDQTDNVYLDPIVGYDSATGSYTTYDLDSEIWIGGSFAYPGYEASIGSTYYMTLAEALAAVKAGETVQILKSGEYALQTLQGANYTLEAVADGVVLKHTPGYASWIAQCTGTVTVKNLTWDVGIATYQYFQNVNVENCTIKGCPFGHTKVNFKSCNFVVESNNDYNIWTYGADAVFDDCTFNCAGKSVLVYKEDGTIPCKVTLNNCVFNASEKVEGKAAIEIDSSLNPYEVYINNCSQTGFAAGSVSNNPLWNNKKGDSSNLKVVVDGVQQTL